MPGDIMLLSEGERISADGEILFSDGFGVDESSLTGESDIVWKSCTDSSSRHWKENCCYCGTNAVTGRAVVRVHCDLPGRHPLALADVDQQLACQLSALAVKHLPTHDFATEHVHKQVQVEKRAPHLLGQVGDVPAVDLIGLRGHQGAWFADLAGSALKAAVRHLPALAQQSVQGRF